MKRFGAFLLVMALVPAFAEAGVVRVWAVNDGEKIQQDDLASPLRARNSAWDGKTVRLFGARNEVIAFQVMVQSDARGIQALTAALPELRQRGGKGRIAYTAPGTDPSQAVGRPIELFAVHYLNVTETTHADWAWKPGSPAAPRDTTGWKPVQLVPENARAGRGGLPLRVAAERNQSIWIEVYTPRDLPAGFYEGAVTVTADGQPTRVPVALQVFDFTLPDANSLDAMVYYEPSQPELYHGRNLDPQYHRFAHRNRIELVHAYDEAAVRASQGRFDGSDFTRAAGYEGPGEGVGTVSRPLLLRARPRLGRPRQRVEARRFLDDVPGRRRPEGEDVPLHARRAVAIRVRAHPYARVQRPLEYRPGQGPARLRHQALGPGA
jgi:hypothetical protein